MASLSGLKEKYGITGSADGAAQSNTPSTGLSALKEKYAALADYADSFKRYELGASSVAKYLQSDNWDDNARHSWYTDLVSSRQEEIKSALAAAGNNEVLKGRLQSYADTYGSLAQGLGERQAFFGQFGSKEEYGSYTSARKAAQESRKTGKSYDAWYGQAASDAKTASARVTELEGELARLRNQAAAGLWDEYGTYLGENHTLDAQVKEAEEQLRQARLEEADKKRISSYAQAWRYDDLPERRDFAGTAAAGLRKFESDRAAAAAAQSEQYERERQTFESMGTGGLAYEQDLMTQLRQDTRWREPTEEWSEQERSIFGFLYASDPERAYEYGQYINDRNKAQQRSTQEQAVGAWADKNAGTWAVSAATGVLTQPAALADYLENLTEYAARGTVTQRASMSPADYGNAMVGAVSQGLNERYGVIDSKYIDSFGWGDVYQLGVSVAQSMFWGNAGKALGAASGLAGEALSHTASASTLGIFFGSAAKSSYEEAKARGADDGQALWYGFAAGVAEAACEVVSIDKLLTIKAPTSVAKLFKNVLLQSGVEASEELATTLCNSFADAVINGDKSEISTQVALGMAKGMSYEEASRAASKSWFQGILRDAIGGFLSGGISGGLQSGFESVGRYGGDVNALIEQGLNAGGEAAETARALQERMRGNNPSVADATASSERRTLPARRDAPLTQGSQETRAAEGVGPYGTSEKGVKGEGDTSSALRAPSPRGEGIESAAQERESAEPRKKKARVSKLEAQKLVEQIENADRESIRKAVEAQLTRIREQYSPKEEKGDVSLIAEAVSKKAVGEKLSAKEKEALKNSPFGAELLRQLDVERIMQGGEIPRWVKEINAERAGGGLYSDVAEVVRSTLRGEGLRSTEGRVSVNGERALFKGLEKNEAGETVARIARNDGSTEQVKVSALDFGANTLLESAVQEMAALPHGPAMMALYREGQDLGGFIDAWQIAEIYGSRSSTTVEAAWEDAGAAIREDITESQFRQAFEMGRREREAKIAEREKEKTTPQSASQTAPLAQGSRGAGTVRFDGAEIEGVKYDAVKKERLSQRQRKQITALQEFAKITGVNITFYQTKADEKGRFRGANGAFFNNTLYLDVNAGMRDSRDNLRVAIIRTAAHELTHYIKENNAEGYEALGSFLVDRLIEWKGRSLAELTADKLARDTTGKLTPDGAIDEVIADGCEMMLRRSSVAEQLARENKSLFERISEWVKGWTQKIRDAFEGVEAYHDEAKAMEKHADELQKRWDAALLGAIRNDRSGQGTKNTAQTGGVQMQERYDYSKSFAEQIDDWKAGRIPQKDTLIISGTPRLWQRVGFNSLPVTIDQTHVDYAVNGTKDADHFLGEDVVKDLSNLIQRPIAIIQSQTEPDRAVVIVRKDHNGKKVIAAVEVDGFGRQNNVRIASNNVMSVLGKTNALVNLYNAIMHTMNGSNELFYWNKREAYALLQGAGHQLPGGLPQDGFVSSIKDTGSNVKTKYAGQTNTPQFKRWFGKSKAVNPDGTPKLFYHGTPNGTFNVFRNWQYFTENEWYADVYQNQGASSNGYKRTADNPKTYAVYLKAEKPFDTRNARERSIFMREFYQKWGNGAPLSDRGLPDWTDADDLIEFFEEKGYDYDSIIVDEGGTGGYGDEVKDRGISWIIRDSNQIKSATDNIGTFDSQNKDIRYQERDFMPDDRELLLEAAEGGQSGRELQEYRKKAQKLEEHKRRLQRLQEAAESAEGAEKDKITEKLRKTEKSILNAEAALRKMEATPQVKRALENATAAWRDANPNEAAKTLRRLREQNRTQEELIDYWKKQARRSELGKETLRKDDVRRAARALLKEHQSEANVDEISEMLQDLGDYMAQNELGAGVEFYEEVKRRAGRIARTIVRNVYQTEDGQAERREALRRYLRETPIQITETIRADMPELDYFRKKHMGTLRFGREGNFLDEVYQSLGDQFGERFFPRDVSAPSDQLNQIVDALEAMEPRYYEMYRDYEAREVSELVAGEIIDTLLSGDVRQSETVADRAYRQMQERLERDYAKQKERLEEKDKRRQQALNDAQDEAQFRYAELQDEKQRRRELVSEKVHELRERSITRDKEYKARLRIAKSVNRLAKALTENGKERHVPEKFKAALGQFLLSVDTLSPRAGEKTQRMYIRQMDEIRKAVAGNLAYMNGNESDWKGMLLDLPTDLAETLQKHIDSVQAAIDGDKSWTTARMDLAQLQELEEIVTVLGEAVTKQNELLAGKRGATVSGVAEETVRYLDALSRAGKDSKLRRFLEYDNTTPYYYFKRFGPAGLQIFRELQVGWGTLARNAKEIMDFTAKLYTDKEVRAAEETVYSFKLHKRLLVQTADGDEALRSAEKETVRMTKAQVMELYALSRRQQALGHILGAGIRVASFREGKLGGEVNQAENYLLTLEELGEITGRLSERDKEIVLALQKFMNSVGSDWGNAVSMERFGIRQFTEENYWPISTDAQGRPVRDPGRDSTNLFRLLNMGFTKNTIRDANNALVLGSAFDTFANHMADMAKYNALGLPLLDAMKWYSYNAISEQSENGQYTTVSLQKSANSALGAGATDYFITFMKDMNGAQEAGRGEGFYQKLLSNVKVASVAANLRVAALQPTAFMRASAVLDGRYMTKGLAMDNRQGREEALKYSNVALWKDLGYYDTNINAGLREKIKGGEGVKSKIQEKSMLLAEWGDKVTWGAIWNACKAQVQGERHLSGEALLAATGELFDEVVYRTQVMDSTMTRSQGMRKKGVFAGMSTAFMSEPTLSYNMVLDACSEFREEYRKSGSVAAAWKNSGDKVGRAFLAYVATASAAAVVESLIDAMRDDDEYESFAEKWLEAMGFRGKFRDGNLWQDLLLHNKIPFVKDIDSLFRGYSNSRMDMEAFSNLKKAWDIWKETIQLANGTLDKPTSVTYNGRMTTWGKLYPTLKALSQLTGLAVSNLCRDAVALWNSTAGAALGMKVKTYDPGPEKSIQYAFQDGYLSEEEARRLLIAEGIESGETEAGQKVYEWGLGGAGKYDAILSAVRKDDRAAYQSALEELTGYGYAEKNIQSQIRTQIKAWFQGTEDTARLDKIKAAALLERYGGMRRTEAEKAVQEWSCYVVTGVQYSELKEAYLDGRFGNTVAIERQMLYGGKSREDAAATVLRWQCEKDTGIAYDDLREAYVYGEISEKQLRGMLAKYGGKSEESVEKTVAVYNFVGKDESLSGISEASAVYYYEAVRESGIGKKDWLAIWSELKGFSGDDRQEQIIGYIDSLSLTPAQKDVLFRFMYSSEKAMKKTTWHR